MLFTPPQRAFAEAHSRYAFVNPFRTAEWAASIAEVVNLPFALADAETLPPLTIAGLPELEPLQTRAELLARHARARLAAGEVPDLSPDEQRLYTDLFSTTLYYRFRDAFREMAKRDGLGAGPVYTRFRREHAYFTDLPTPPEAHIRDPARIFACLFLVCRAYDLVCHYVRGNSRPIDALRAAIWHSVFTSDFRMYGHLYFDRMQDITTLIVGPSGTGKELVATAIGLSRFVPYDPRSGRFTDDLPGAFHPLNLSALPRDLIESEMFGHCAGAFTGAVRDRQGWFERCGPSHSVFLDEIGELDASVQVKLLRVLQNRQFQRIGETEPRTFHGKVIAATNRNLAQEMEAGRFREDLYYRLCSDLIRTPSLREQLDDYPADLPLLVELVVQRCLGDRDEPQHVQRLTEIAVHWIERSPALGLGYHWPGNFRELEQCVRNIIVRGEYHPAAVAGGSPTPSPASLSGQQPQRRQAAPASARLAHDVQAGRLSLDELVARYTSLVFARSGNVAETARKLGKHRRTVKAHLRQQLVDEFLEPDESR